ncbi:MAG: HNH endonuclease [Nitrospira sp.]|nr:HNH endonuclease [Nitrospira sp.]
MRQEFSSKTRLAAWERSQGMCECGCGQTIKPERPEYHHRIEAGLGGGNDIENCVVLKKSCHRAITSGHSVPMLAKVKRIRMKAIGAWPKSRRPLRSRGFENYRERDAD